jgi:putative ATPase
MCIYADESKRTKSENLGNLPIPMSLRNPETKLMEDLGYGKGYEKYPKDKNLLPKKLKGKRYYKRKK